MSGIDHAMAGAAELLRYAAAPSFAAMALLSGLLGTGPDILCGQQASLLTGMAPMYLLMSVFHLAPWLRHGTKAPRSASSATD
jgi:hypothetical protein